MFGKPSQEEMQARYRAMAERSVLKNGELPTVPEGTQQVIYSPGNTLGLNYGDAAPTIHEHKGRKYIRNPHGSGDFVYNERTGAYHAPGDGGILMFSPAKAQAEDEDEDGNGSGNGGNGGNGGNDDNGGDNDNSGGNKPKPETPTVTYARPNKKVIGHKTDQSTILGSTYDDMVNYQPVTPGQKKNSLVNAGNWMVKLNPEHSLAKDPGQLKWKKPIVLSPYSIS